MEEATMEEGLIAEAPGATTFTLYIPDFLQEYSLSNKSLFEQKNKLLRKDCRGKGGKAFEEESTGQGSSKSWYRKCGDLSSCWFELALPC
jgi:hypothetical protein